jgi:HSP20 family protein
LTLYLGELHFQLKFLDEGPIDALQEELPMRKSRSLVPLFDADPFMDLFQPFLSSLKYDGPLGGWRPPTDIAETDSAYVLTVELPGLKKEDVTVEAHEGTLTIRGERASEKEGKHHVERAYGSFSRAFTLPSDTAQDQVKATFADGLLTVEIPKAEERKPRTVVIR